MSDVNGNEPARSPVAELMADQLQAERTRHASIEQRGITVITTSGTLITLLLALAGLTGRTAGFKLAKNAQVWLLTALIFLTLAAIAGIIVNFPGRGRSVGLYPEEIKSLLEDPTMDNIDRMQFKGLRRASRANRRKSISLLVALIIQAVGIGSLAYTVWLALKPA